MHQYLTKLTALFIATFSLQAFSTEESKISITDPWARAVKISPESQQPTSAAFMVIHNNSDQEMKLVGANCDACEHMELHTHIQEGDVFKMRPIESISIPPHDKTVLKSGGLHLMFMNVKQDFEEGKTIDVTLTFADGSSQVVPTKIKKCCGGCHGKTKASSE